MSVSITDPFLVADQRETLMTDRLMKKGRYPAAFDSYRRLRKHPLQAARDMYYSHVLFVEEKAMAAGTTYWSRNVDCWKVPRLRHASLAACTVMIAQQM